MVQPTRARRLAPEERERQIVSGAIAYFAEHGLDAQLRDLADHLGITHPLLYRYFPTKEALVERVYEEFYATRWQAGWDLLLRDASLTLEERLTRFYAAYLDALEDGPWLRIFAFSGLQNQKASQHYMASIRVRVIQPIAAGLQALASSEGGRPEPALMELAWALHGELCFNPICNRLLGIPAGRMTSAQIRQRLSAWLNGYASAPIRMSGVSAVEAGSA
ncbi:TetR/AcrR family transcriptional regulator [Roseomonas populi]|uniref:TetR/AcrR family transcriptional regulator n=1 Tax=Roseomonas populi TaxID=3121582 RepID=A0ABT1X6V7_9PROT|nr:TetR/AcrR family transcriptional regulator [Roseomonas pecuniae]MCR0983840.1 TetR/AcrR family transcriptional regulator [Roseomonas pecuniae]